MPDFATIAIAPYNNRNKDLSFYKAVNDFYSGNVRNQTYIIAHRSERPKSQAKEAPHVSDRISRTPYDNPVKPIVIKHRSALAQPLVISGLDPESELILDVDGEGNSLGWFMVELVETFLKEGRSCLLTEAPEIATTTEAEALAVKQRPYLFNITPERLFRFSFFGSGPSGGSLKELVFENGVSEIEGEKVTKFRQYYFPEGSTKYHVRDLWVSTDKLKDHIDGPLDFYVEEDRGPFYEIIPARVFGKAAESSLLEGIWQRAHHILNMRSVYVELIYKQAFRITIVSQTGPGDKEALQTISESTLAVVPGEISLSSIEPSDFRQIDEYIDKREAALVKAADHRLIQLTIADTKQTQSAESKEKDEAPKIHIYNEILDLLARELTQVYRHMLRFNNTTISEDSLAEVNIDFERQFGLEDSELDMMRLAEITDDAEAYDENTQLVVKREITKLKIAGINNDSARETILEALENATLKRRQLAPSFGLPQENDA